MNDNYKLALAWTIGYFITLFPAYYVLTGSWVLGLMTAIYGVAGAILLIKYGNKIGGNNHE